MKDIEKEMFEKRVIFLTGDFDETHCSDLVKQILYLENSSTDDITIYLDSYGGEVYSFLNVTNIIINSKCKFNIIAMGKAMSAGAQLLVMGTKRYAYINTQILIHELAYNNGYLKLSEHDIAITANKRLQQLLDDMLIKYTKLKKKDVQSFKFKDIYLNANQALEFGIIDEIIGD